VGDLIGFELGGRKSFRFGEISWQREGIGGLRGFDLDGRIRLRPRKKEKRKPCAENEFRPLKGVFSIYPPTGASFESEEHALKRQREGKIFRGDPRVGSEGLLSYRVGLCGGERNQGVW